jgi:hypothetical protein
MFNIDSEQFGFQLLVLLVQGLVLDILVSIRPYGADNG